ncbi:hypothetical protein EW145_g3420 [Phellinidium pouzarii]|uniref:Uncharacterized protein n=1 Tax=Phellinidium pouzarii TaxID=167371 RepID=A0A4S4L7K3_9AGAM|nr:hypothetical protein EW145_g3420 [Phellinidium pouzarii]
MHNATSTYRRRLGRAPSPPTWLWYEQIPFDDDTSESGESGGEYESCSEDDEDYARADRAAAGRDQDSESSSGSDDQRPPLSPIPHAQQQQQQEAVDGGPQEASENGKSGKMDIDGEGTENLDASGDNAKKDIKGKQRAVEPEVSESPKRRERRKKHRDSVITFRPILTIQKSQGFVWNQVYVASTSPPNGSGFLPTPVSSFNDYEVDVVEIRVKEGEYADIIP